MLEGVEDSGGFIWVRDELICEGLGIGVSVMEAEVAHEVSDSVLEHNFVGFTWFFGLVTTGDAVLFKFFPITAA